MSQRNVVLRHQISAEAFQVAREHFARLVQAPESTEHSWKIENRLGLTETQLALSCLLLDCSRYQQFFAASPLLSHFRVASSIFCGPGKTAHGANAEFGAGPDKAVDDGVHSEEAAITNALNLYGKNTRVEIVALTTDSATPSTPCGKCRSLLETYSRGDPVIISAGTEPSASMWRLSELLPHTFPAINPAQLPQDQRLHFTELYEISCAQRSPEHASLSEQAVGFEHAVIRAHDKTFCLPRVDSLAFYPTTSLRATIAAVLATGPSRIDAVMLTSRSGVPIGEDRQLLFEFANLFNQSTTLPVYLRIGSNGEILRATPAALLPHAFGPNDLSL
jgi:cytidine deaminase